VSLLRTRRTVSRSLTVSAVVVSGALALSACGSDNNSTSSSGGAAAGGSTAGASSPANCFSGTLNGEGSTAQKNAIEAAIKAFQSGCGDATINYNATGSGAGIKQFTGKQVDFAGSDSALKTEEAASAKTACGSDAWNLPMVAGPIAIAYNVKGLNSLVLNAEVAAKIFNGVVTTWNDPAITTLNAGASLPATPIKVFFRSDESGTTENFTSYLKAAAPSVWTAAPAKKWTGKGEGKEKSAGVSSAVASTDGGITYTEWSYVSQNKLAMARIDTGSGTPVELTGATAGKAVAAATQVGTGNDLALKLDYATKADGAYPIVLMTYEIVCSKYADANKGKAVNAFLTSFASDQTQSGLEELGYAPLPKEVQSKVQTAVGAVS
jgi:phosphate transport system substrate-binding protein